MERKFAYKLTGLVILAVGVLFLLRDMGLNIIGETSGWTIFIVLLGASLLAGGEEILMASGKKAPKKL